MFHCFPARFFSISAVQTDTRGARRRIGGVGTLPERSIICPPVVACIIPVINLPRSSTRPRCLPVPAAAAAASPAAGRGLAAYLRVLMNSVCLGPHHLPLPPYILSRTFCFPLFCSSSLHVSSLIFFSFVFLSFVTFFPNTIEFEAIRSSDDASPPSSSLFLCFGYKFVER